MIRTYGGVRVEASDGQLMAQIQAGSADALGELYDRYCDRAYRIAFDVCRDADLAEDAVKNAFLSVWSSGASYREQRGTVAARLLTCVRERAIELARSNAIRTGQPAPDDRLDTPGPEDTARQVASRAEAEHLQTLLDRLPDDLREVITLASYGGLSHTDIAAQLDLPPGTVKGRMRLGMHKLRATLDRATG